MANRFTKRGLEQKGHETTLYLGNTVAWISDQHAAASSKQVSLFGCAIASFLHYIRNAMEECNHVIGAAV
jgi:hypothetical protein